MGWISPNFAQCDISASKNPAQGNHLACFLSRNRFSVFRNPEIWSYVMINVNSWNVCVVLEIISTQKKNASQNSKYIFYNEHETQQLLCQPSCCLWKLQKSRNITVLLTFFELQWLVFQIWFWPSWKLLCAHILLVPRKN